MGKYKEEFSIILLSAICSLFALVYIFYAAVQKKFGAILILAIAMLAVGTVMIIMEISILKNKINGQTDMPKNGDDLEEK